MSEQRIQNSSVNKKHCNLLSNIKITFSNYFFEVYFIYVLAIWLIDGADFVAYLLGVKQCTFLSRVLALLVLGSIFFLMRNKIEVKSKRITVLEGVLSSVIFLVAFIKSFLPDLGFDTTNYHIIAQYSGFTNHLVENYGVGWFQVWGFKLGDRLFYYFRCLLGYRGGTLLNALVTVLIYRQLVIFLREYLLKDKKQIYGIIEIMAFIAVLAQDVMQQFGTYYVDLLAIPLVFECVMILFSKKNERYTHFFFALIAGFLVSFKLTNIVFAVPICLFYLVKILFQKKYKYWDFGVILFLGILPSSIYMVFNYIETRNPVFPYYNSIFKSEYWALENFKDGRWGPLNLIETIMWPINFAFKPQYRQSEIPLFFTYGYVLAIAVLVGYTVYCAFKCLKKKKIESLYLNISIWITFFAAYVWAFTTGYLRYFTVGQIMLVLLAECVVYLAALQIKGVWQKIVIISFAIVWISVPIQGYIKVYEGWEWSFRNNKYFSLESNNLFKDYALASYDRFEDASLIIVSYENHSTGYSISREVGARVASTVWLDNGLYYPEEVYVDMTDLLDASFKEGKVFFLSDNLSEEFYDKLSSYGMSIVSEELMTTNIKNFYVVQVEKD